MQKFGILHVNSNLQIWTLGVFFMSNTIHFHFYKISEMHQKFKKVKKLLLKHFLFIWKKWIYTCSTNEFNPARISYCKLYIVDDRYRSDTLYLLASVNSFEKSSLFELISVYMRIWKSDRALQQSVFIICLLILTLHIIHKWL